MQVTKDRQQKRLTTKEERVSTNQTDTRIQAASTGKIHGGGWTREQMRDT